MLSIDAGGHLAIRAAASDVYSIKLLNQVKLLLMENNHSQVSSSVRIYIIQFLLSFFCFLLNKNVTLLQFFFFIFLIGLFSLPLFSLHLHPGNFFKRPVHMMFKNGFCENVACLWHRLEIEWTRTQTHWKSLAFTLFLLPNQLTNEHMENPFDAGLFIRSHAHSIISENFENRTRHSGQLQQSRNIDGCPNHIGKVLILFAR